MKVKEIMIKDVFTLSPGMNAKEALDLLAEKKISGLPVVDENKKLVGMFTEKEVLARILPTYVEAVGKFIYEENPKAVKQKVISFASFTVEQIMRKNVVTVNEDATLCEVAHVILTQKARRLPVVNKDSGMVGIVLRGDVIKHLFAEYI
ncbi:MAG: CBS domain-containing protein [Candidatus Omnitrophica bacterium]|nr:CBS domain-containing protein [Candidatus Omnitrophota bacterium]